MHFFETMFRMRRLEIAADMQYKAKMIRGFCHLCVAGGWGWAGGGGGFELGRFWPRRDPSRAPFRPLSIPPFFSYDGQEAVMMGIEAATTRTDSIITSYRDHCTLLARGGTPHEVMAELMGRATGATKGMGGSMHMYKRDANFFGGQGIVGAQARAGRGGVGGLRPKHSPRPRFPTPTPTCRPRPHPTNAGPRRRWPRLRPQVPWRRRRRDGALRRRRGQPGSNL